MLSPRRTIKPPTGPRAVTRVRRALTALLLSSLVALSAAGCGGKAKQTRPYGSDLIVRSVKLRGVRRFSKSKVLRHLYVGETRRLPLSPDYSYDEALLAADRQRLEELYRAYGYAQARVTGLEVTTDLKSKRADVLFEVDEGPVTTLEAVTYVWQDEHLQDPAQRAAVQRLADLRAGQPYEVDRINDAVGTVRFELQRRGHPLAQARALLEEDEAGGRARVKLYVQAGPHARIGAVRFEGLQAIPEGILQRELEFLVGEPYSPARTEQVRRVLKALRVFRWVAVVPAERVEGGRIGLVAKVSEAHPQSIRVGGQVSFEATRWQEQVRANYSHTNLLGDLTRLDVSTLLGWAELPNPFAPDQHGPVVRFTPRLSRKGILERHLQWSLTPSVSTDVQPGYQYWSPSNRLGVSRWFGGALRASLSHTVRYVDFFGLTPGLDNGATQLGRDFRDPFVLSYVELRQDLFFVDSITSPRDGVVLDLTYALAGGAFLGDYDFHKLSGGVRAYSRPLKRLQIAARIRAGLIQPYGADAGVPFSLKYYLGGANTVRGWGSRRLSPRLQECDDGGSCESVPIGGLTMVQANLELRWHLGWWVYLVGFADLGDVQAAERTVTPGDWSLTTGPGLRLDSPVGLFRLDAGFLLPQRERYPDEPTWAIYFGLGETF